MGKLSITENKLLKEYNKEIDNILEACDWKSTFTGEEVCGIVVTILSENNVATKLTLADLHNKYSKRVKNLNITKEEWVKNYGIPEIIHMIYNILEENN